MEKPKKKIITIRDYFNPPIFDWYHKWDSMDIDYFSIYPRDNNLHPLSDNTRIIWKSRRTGKVKTKEYNYQINK